MAKLAGRPLDHDLFCLKCAYNLRGLSGDPVRCPECGNLNPLGDAEIPAAMVVARLRKMETAPCVCVACVLVGVPVQIPFWLVVQEWRHYGFVTGGEGVLCLGLAGLIAAVGWIASAAAFRRSCGAKLGWVGLLVRYHLLGVPGAGTLFAAPFLVAWFVPDRRPLGNGEALLLTAGALVTLGLLAFFVVRLYRLLSERMQLLQREVAVGLLRDEARRRAAGL